MPRVTTCIVSNYQRDRTHRADFQRGESRDFTVDFRALVPDGQSLAYAEWWCLRPDVTYLTTPRCGDTSCTVNVGCLNNGGGVLKVKVTLTDGSKFVQMCNVFVSVAPWFYPDTTSLPSSPTYLRADNLGVLMIYGNAPNGYVGSAYSYDYTASGGTPPYAFSVFSGTLPPGLSLASSGVLSGTPSAQGNYSWAVEVIDQRGAARTLNDGAAIGAKLTYEQVVLADGPNYFWPLNDADNTAVELIQGYNGTYSGTSYQRQQTSLMPNGQGGSVLLSSLDAQIVLPPSDDVASFWYPITVEYWFRAQQSVTNLQTYFAINSQNGAIPFNFEVDTDYFGRGHLRRAGSSSGFDLTTADQAMPVNTAYCIHVVSAQDHMAWYVNGVMIKQAAYALEAGNPVSGPQAIGSMIYGGEGASTVRSMQNLAIYKKLLTDDQIMAHYQAGIS